MKPRAKGAGRRAGLTLLEASLGLTLTAIVAYKAYGALQTVSETQDRTSSQLMLEEQARRVIQQIGYAVMSASRERLMPDIEPPGSFDDIRFQVNLGLLAGEVVWSDPEEVGLEDQLSQVLWRENPDEEHERRVVWTNLVAPFLEGEIPNGMDDNGNGLIDEKGLSFTINGDAVTIRLTLERINEEGQRVSQSVETTVTCRNFSTGGES